MLSKSEAFVVVAFTLACVLGDAAKPPMQSSQLHVRPRIVKQAYCRGDADLFTVSIKLDIQVANDSNQSVYLKKSMVPWVAKVARTVADAESGQFMFEITQSHYYPPDFKESDMVRIGEGKSATLHAGYDLVARYDPGFSYPKSISAGTYAIVLILRPEIDSSTQSQDPQVIKSLTTEPFVLEVSKHPAVKACRAR